MKDLLSIATNGYLYKYKGTQSIATEGYLSIFAIILKRGKDFVFSSGEKGNLREEDEILLIIKLFTNIWNSYKI